MNFVKPCFLGFVFAFLFGGCQIKPIQTHTETTVKFYSDEYFRKALTQLDEKHLPNFEPVIGGVVPHDIFPGFITARFFDYLSKNPPHTIIIIGPNHDEKGRAKVITSSSSWKTQYGTLTPNTTITKRLMEEKLVLDDTQVVVEDHATTSIMPYISYFLPNTKVVPLMLSGTMTQSEIASLADILKPELNSDTVAVAAVDFSHYLRSAVAEKKDSETIQVVRTGDIRQLLTFGNDHLDSPPSIALLMMLMGKRDFTILDHTNSGKIQAKEFVETTSYYSIVYPK